MKTTSENVIVVDESTGRKRKRSSSSKLGESETKEEEHEVHIFTERERRKRMRNMFTGLHALLPHLPSKADKSTIVDEAVKYIKDLQETLETLENQKQQTKQYYHHHGPILSSSSFSDSEVPSVITSPAEAIDESRQLQETLIGCNFETWLSPNVVMNMCGNDAQMSVCSSKKIGLLTNMVYILQKHKLDVVSAHVSSDHTRSIYMFHLHAGEGYGKYNGEGFSVEDLFKLAAGEINLYMASFSSS